MANGSAMASGHYLGFQRVGSQRYFDAAGFRGRTLRLEAEGGKQKTAGK